MDASSTAVLIGVIISSIPGIIGAIVAIWIAKKKTPVEVKKSDIEVKKIDVDIDDTNVKSAILLIEPMRKRIAELEEYREKQDAINDELRFKLSKMELEIREAKDERNQVINGAYMLWHQVKSSGGIPVYTPPEYQGGV